MLEPMKEAELVKQKLDIVAVLKGYITLTPAGKNFKAICPFHNEKTPSFMVSPDRQSWHCFGSCQEGGDVIKFVMKYENLEFPEALRFLAEKAGVPLPSFQRREERMFYTMYDIYAEAKSFFVETLANSPEAMEYVRSRGLKEETVKDFAVGYAPGGEALTLRLLQKKFSLEDILNSGLSVRTRQGLNRDRFQNRLMFPIQNSIGKTVAFGGRILPKYESDTEPKYVNSSDSPIYNKSKILYGFDRTKGFIAKSKSVMLVEGYMDAVMAWQGGVKNVAAVSGTALTPHHLERLRRLSDSLLLCFDSDLAGIKAMERSLDLILPLDFYVHAVDLGKYKDAGEAVQAEPEFLAAAVKSAQPAFHALIKVYSAAVNGRDMSFKKRAVRHLLRKILKMKSAVERDQWLHEMAGSFSVAEGSLREDLNNLPPPKQGLEEAGNQGAEKMDQGGLPRVDLIARRALALALAFNEFWDIIRAKRDFFPPLYHSFVDNPSAANGMLEMQASLSVGSGDREKAAKEIESLLSELQREYYRRRQEELKREIRTAQNKGEDATALMAELGSVAGKLNSRNLDS
jgi:DNA primase